VKKIENVILQAKEAKQLENTNADINLLMKELIDSHTIG
jgi:electron transfer flavoprotein beta subunit